MPDLQPHMLDWAVCRDQAQEFKALLDGLADVGEAVFHDFFQPRRIYAPYTLTAKAGG